MNDAGGTKIIFAVFAIISIRGFDDFGIQGCGYGKNFKSGAWFDGNGDIPILVRIFIIFVIKIRIESRLLGHSQDLAGLRR